MRRNFVKTNNFTNSFHKVIYDNRGLETVAVGPANSYLKGMIFSLNAQIVYLARGTLEAPVRENVDKPKPRVELRLPGTVSDNTQRNFTLRLVN